MVINADTTSDTRGEYYIIDINKTYYRITLNEIEKIRIKTGEDTYNTLNTVIDSEGKNSVTIDLTGVEPQESVEGYGSKIIEPNYWKVANLPANAESGQYGITSTGVLYKYDTDDWI